MYTLLAAKTLSTSARAQWTDANLVNAIVATTVYANRKIILKVQRDAEPPFWTDFDELKPEYALYANTFGVLLQLLSTRTLTALSTLPFGQFKYAKYSDARQSGYVIQYAIRGVELPVQYPLPEKQDLELTRPGTTTDVSLLHSHALVSVNGFFHNTDSDGSRAWVVDGGKTMQYGNLNHVGITSFLKVGALTKQVIDADAIQPRSEDGTLKDRVVLTTDLDLTGKSVLLVLGGYLVWPEEGVFYAVGEHSFEIDLKRLQYIERLLESRNYIDLSSLQLTPFTENSELINLDEAWSDAVIRRYFQLSQTYLVVVDTDNLFYTRYPLRPMKLPGLFTTTEEPDHLLIVGTGHHTEYWKEAGDHRYSVSVLDKYYRNYLFGRNREGTVENVSGMLDAQRPFFYSQGFFFEIGTATPEN